MSPRQYDMSRRVESVAETRTSILAAAIELFEEEGFRGASIGRIAARADVTRATVYHHFETKLGLLEALVADTADRAGISEILAIGESAATPEDVYELLDAFTRFWASHDVLFRNVMGLAGVDPEAAGVIEARDENRRRGVEALARRLAEHDALAAGVSEHEAAHTLWLLTSFAVFDQLARRSGLELTEVASVLSRLASVLFVGSSALPGLTQESSSGGER